MTYARIRTLTRCEWRALLPVARALSAVWVGLKLVPADQLARIVGVPLVLCDAEAAPPAEWKDLTPRRQEELRLLAALLRRRPFRSASRCLQESLTIGILMRRDRPRLRLGVSRDGGAVRAHAWVEAAGRSFLADPVFAPLGPAPSKAGYLWP